MLVANTSGEVGNSSRRRARRRSDQIITSRRRACKTVCSDFAMGFDSKPRDGGFNRLSSAVSMRRMAGATRCWCAGGSDAWRESMCFPVVILKPAFAEWQGSPEEPEEEGHRICRPPSDAGTPSREDGDRRRGVMTERYDFSLRRKDHRRNGGNRGAGQGYRASRRGIAEIVHRGTGRNEKSARRSRPDRGRHSLMA